MTATATRPTLKPLLLALLALLSAFTPLSIDTYLPAMPMIATDLRGTAGDIQLTLSAFLIAFGFGQIFYGPAGDRFGRRPVILTGLRHLRRRQRRLRFRRGSGVTRGCCACCRAWRRAAAWCWRAPWCATSRRRTRRRGRCR